MLLKHIKEASLSNDIWNELRPLLNSITDIMKKIFKNVCDMQEFHLMVDKYCAKMSVEEMDRRVEHMVKSTDDIFKKDTQFANDKRDENDENGVILELGEDQNEMAKNLNSALSDDFV